MNYHVSKPEYARWTITYVGAGRWRLVDPTGMPQPTIYAGREAALTAMGCAQARTDAAARKGVRPCMCCRSPFESDGIHDRLCDACGRHGDEWAPYGISTAARGGRKPAR